MSSQGYYGQCLAKGSADNIQVENFLFVGGGGDTPDNVWLGALRTMSGQRVPRTMSKLKILCSFVLHPDKITGTNQYQRGW